MNIFSGENCSQLVAAEPEMTSGTNPLNIAQTFLRPDVLGRENFLDLPKTEPIQWESQMEMALKPKKEHKTLKELI